MGIQEGQMRTDVVHESCIHEMVLRQLSAHNLVMQRVTENVTRQIVLTTHTMLDTLVSGGKAVFFGNGGNAACAQYWASLLLGRHNAERPGLPAIALTADAVVLTNIGNDYGYHDVFARQVHALVGASDVVVGICSTGLSTNVLAGVRMAKANGARTIGLSGGDGGQLAAMVDHAIVVPSAETARVQEAHVIVAHLVCHLLDDRLASLANEELSLAESLNSRRLVRIRESKGNG